MVASFVVSGNDRPHPDLLPRGEGTAIAYVSLRGCTSCESSRGWFDVQGFKARVCWGKSLTPFGGERESDKLRHYRNGADLANMFSPVIFESE